MDSDSDFLCRRTVDIVQPNRLPAVSLTWGYVESMTCIGSQAVFVFPCAHLSTCILRNDEGQTIINDVLVDCPARIQPFSISIRTGMNITQILWYARMACRRIISIIPSSSAVQFEYSNRHSATQTTPIALIQTIIYIATHLCRTLEYSAKQTRAGCKCNKQTKSTSDD
jgi:hypothetical protein